MRSRAEDVRTAGFTTLLHLPRQLLLYVFTVLLVLQKHAVRLTIAMQIHVETGTAFVATELVRFTANVAIIHPG